MPTENSVITREHLPGLLLARTIWENGGPSLYFPPALQDATDQARAALPAPASVPDGYMPIPTAEQIADALDGVRCYHDMSAELIAPELLANLLAATTVKAEQVQCEVCHGQGEVYSGHDQHFHYFDFQPPEPIMEVCPECGGEEAPSLPAAGSAVEEVVPQYQRGALLIDSDTMSRFTRIAREAAISGVHRYSYMPTTPEEAKNWHPHSWVIDAMHLVQRDALSALSAQQSAPPEFCCEHSYKVAKQSAWDACDLTHCKCDHNEYCEHCWPDDFREGGKWHGGFETKQSAQDDEYPPCDYCGVVPDYHPWHGSGAFRGVENPHIHACNDCRHLLPTAQSAPERVSVPSDLLADLISSDHDTKIQAERALYALLASHAEGGKV